MSATVLLVGFPNAGKSTIYNLLSGQARKVSNYLGVTVDAGLGELKSNREAQKSIRVVDLPGIHGISPQSQDEGVTLSTILGLNKQIQDYNSIAVVVDFSRLESSLSLVLALKDLVGDKLFVIINKSDLKSDAHQADWDRLKEMINLDVFIFSALKDSSIALDQFLRERTGDEKVNIERYLEVTHEAATQFQIPPGPDTPYKITEDVEGLLGKLESYQKSARQLAANINAVLDHRPVEKTYKIDRVLLHPFWGTIVFFSIFYFLFHAIYTWSGPMMDIVESVIVSSGDFVGGFLPEGVIRSLVVDGAFAGVGGVIVFLPQIMILFFLLSLLEQSGYIARAAYISDKVMSFAGLNGKAFLPYLSGFACAIPAIMATRSISNFKERMATLMTIPFITCSARLPVYILLIGVFIPNQTVFGIFNQQALALFFLYFFGSVMALVMAKVFRLTYFKGKTGSFYMEMPLYQKPSLKVAFRQMKNKAMVFLKKAGTTIFGLSLLIWVLSSFPKPTENLISGKSPQEVASIELEHSVLGKIGKTIEPVIRPLGYDWKMGVGLLVAFGARELFVSAMGTIYALGDVDEKSDSLRNRLLKEKDLITGKPVYSMAVAWSLLIFFALACQCLSTLAIVKRETGGWFWPSVMFSYMGLIAYAGAFITYRLLV